jgi:hypothetical protein
MIAEPGGKDARVRGERWELQAASSKLEMASSGIRDFLVNVICQTFTLKL